jgi:hypothetical protein
MALSERMQALIQKIDAAEEAYFAGLRELAKKQAAARAGALGGKLANLRLARARSAENKKRRMPVQSNDSFG